MSTKKFISVHDLLHEDENNVDIEELPPVLRLSIHGGNYIDYKTKNKDFIRMHRILKAKGIERNDFFLKVYDHDLIGVDPFDPRLSMEMKKKIVRECTINFWYFARELIRFRAPGGSIPCQLNLGNLAFYFCKLMCIDVAIEMPRQFGKTGGELIILIWAGFFILNNTMIGMMNKSEDNTTKDLDDMKTIIRNLPDFVKIYDPENIRTGTNNSKSIHIKHNNVTIKTFLSSKNASQANSKGRGFSIPFVNIDEACFVDQFKQFYLGFRPAMSKQVELAKKQRTIYGCTLSTTSGTTLDPDQKFFKENILDRSAKFNAKLLDFTTRRQMLKYMAGCVGKVNTDDKDKALATSSFIYIRYDYNQLGKGLAYLRQMESELEYDEDSINKDIKLRWVDYSKSSPYRREYVERLQDYVKEPIHTIMIDDYYPLNFFTSVTDWDFTYMISVDVSAGKGGASDSSCIVIHDPRTLEVVATYKSNVIDIPQLTFLVKEIGTKLFTGACICVEVNGVGHGIVQSLAYDDQIKPRLYHEKVDLNMGTVKSHNILKPAEFGFLSKNNAAMDGKTSTMYKGIIADAIENDYEILRDGDLIAQIGNLEKNAKSGRIEAAYGKHKDMVSAFAIGRWAMLHSDTIGKWISPSVIRSIKLDSGTIVTGNQNLDRDIAASTNNICRALNKQKTQYDDYGLPMNNMTLVDIQSKEESYIDAQALLDLRRVA